MTHLVTVPKWVVLQRARVGPPVWPSIGAPCESEMVSGITRQRCLVDGEGYRDRIERKKKRLLDHFFPMFFSICTDLNGFKESVRDALKISKAI